MWFGGWTLRELAIDGTRQNGVGPKPDCDVDGRPKAAPEVAGATRRVAPANGCRRASSAAPVANRGTLLVEVAQPELADHIRGMEGIADFLSA